MKQYYFSLSLFLIFLSSCFPLAEEPAYVVRNESDDTFQKMTLTTNQKVVTYYNIYPGYYAKGKLTFNKINKMDGGYGLHLYNNDILVRHADWGYFTNGASLDKNCDITIKNDTIIVKENTGL